MIQPDGTLRSIVYVHGIGNKVSPDLLKRQWDRDLFSRGMGERTRVVYWADILYPYPLRSEAARRVVEEGAMWWGPPAGVAPEQISSRIEQGIPDDPEARAFVHSVAAAQARYAERLRAEMLPVLGEIGLDPEVLGPIGNLLFQPLVSLFLKDAAAYFFGEERKLIGNRLRGVLDEIESPLLLIAHSLGSIICYDVLNEPAYKEKEVPLFVTIGSQLGVSEIQARVHKPLEIPENVSVWRNFFDRWDISVMAQTLSDEFRPQGRVVDTEVDNTSPNNHSSPGYLRAPQLRRAVDEAMSAIVS